MFDGLSFGWRTAVLTLAAVQLLTIALGLTGSGRR
jgi:anti-sigma-K factor RskA